MKCGECGLWVCADCRWSRRDADLDFPAPDCSGCGGQNGKYLPVVHKHPLRHFSHGDVDKYLADALKRSEARWEGRGAIPTPVEELQEDGTTGWEPKPVFVVMYRFDGSDWSYIAPNENSAETLVLMMAAHPGTKSVRTYWWDGERVTALRSTLTYKEIAAARM